MSKTKSVARGRARRDGDKERVWRERIAEQQRGGESVRAFCRERGLRETSFYYWRRQIRLRDREPAGNADTPGRSHGLAPVVLIDDPLDGAAASTPAATAIEIVLGDGTTVRVPPGSTGEQLAAVLAVLEPARC